MAYTKIRAVTIKTGQVPSTQTDAPLLLSFTHADFKDVSNGGFCRTDGADLDLFSDITLLSMVKFRKEFYDPVNGIITMWFKAGTVVDGATWYFGFGDSGKSTVSDDAPNVYDSHDKGVWSFTPTSGALTATNYVTGGGSTVSGPAATTGQIYGASTWNGSTDRITTDLSSFTMPAAITVHAWVYRTANGNAAPRVTHMVGGYGQLFSGATTLNYIAQWTGVQGSWAIAAPSDNAWHHVVVTYDTALASNDPIFYVDGAVQTLTADTNPTGSFSPAAGQYYLGNTENSNRAWQGNLDEIRIADIVRSADWVTVQYRNQVSQSNFWDLGATQNFPIVADLSTSLYEPVVGSSRF